MTDFRVPLRPDGSVDIDEMTTAEVCKVYEKELDTLHSRTKPAGNHTAGTAERERFERDCEQFRLALAGALSQTLRSQGIDVGAVTFRRLEETFHVAARDHEHTHRDYSVDVEVATLTSISEMHDRAPFEAVVKAVVERVLEARAHYLHRMS